VMFAVHNSNGRWPRWKRVLGEGGDGEARNIREAT
jgi:hypothetical protein